MEGWFEKEKKLFKERVGGGEGCLKIGWLGGEVGGWVMRWVVG